MLSALRLLTALGEPTSPRSVPPRALLWFPLVGLLVGLAWAVPGFTLGLRFPSAGVPAAVVLIVDALLTRGLHLRAAAAVADGAAKDRRVGAREPGVGASGAVLIVLVCLLRYGALTFSADFGYRLFAAPVTGRAAMVALLWPDATRGTPPAPVALGAAALTLAAVLPSGPRGVTALGLGMLAALAFALWYRSSAGEIAFPAAAAGGLLAETVALLVLSSR